MKLHFDETTGQIRDETEFPIAYIDRIAHERFPDLARQMAAAPRLLAALKALVPPDFDDHAGDFMDDWHEARAAIREAEGEPTTSRGEP